MKRIEAIKIIKKELKKENTNWELIRQLSRTFGLQDTAYKEKLFRKDKEKLLKDWLLTQP